MMIRFVANSTVTVENKDSKVKKSRFASVVANLEGDKDLIRHETLEGRDHIVVPCVMITEGVHNGSAGPLYYPPEELGMNTGLWDHKPIVVYHPVKNGQSISACSPEEINARKIGLLLNTKWEDGKLKTECWLEESRIKEVDERVWNALEENTVMEVSTGLLADLLPDQGVWNGEEYEFVASNYRPDHLAILPDQEGACSIEDGAGLLRNQANDGTGVKSGIARHLLSIFNELSHDEIWSAIFDKIRGSNESEMNKWLSQVYDEFFIYEEGDVKYYQKYSIDDQGEVTLEGIRQEISEVRYYELPDGTRVGNQNQSNNNQKEKVMDKEKIINDLIANEDNPWSEEDRETLMAFDDDKLKHIANVNEEPETPPEPETPEPQPEASNQEVANQQSSVKTLEQYLAEAPPEIRGVLTNAQMAYNSQRNEVIAKIIANKANRFTQEQLEAKELGELQAIAELAQAGVANTENPIPSLPPGPQPIFTGMAEPAQVSNTQGDEEPLLPSGPLSDEGSE